MAERKNIEELIQQFFDEGLANSVFDESLLLEIVELMFIKRHNSFKQYEIYNNPDERKDIKQDAKIRVLKSYMTGFIKRNPGVINDNPEGFAAWINTVITNVVKSANKKYRKENSKTINNEIEDDDGDKISILDNLPDAQEEEPDYQQTVMISNCVHTVLSMKNKIQKLMIWLEYMTFLSLPNEDHVTALNEVDVFKSQTFYEIYDFIYARFKQFPWYDFDEEFKELKLRLDEEESDGISIGYHKVSFYYNQKGKYTVSDWVNNINSKLKKKLGGK